MTWDRGNSRSKRPTWSPPEVSKLLDGLSYRQDSHTTKSPRDGVHYPYRELYFACGCVVTGDVGWTACGGNSLHIALAAEVPVSAFVGRYKHLRAVFDEELATSWRMNGQRSGEHDADFRAFHRVGIGEWRKNHDLCDNLICNDLGLSADLTDIPFEARLQLYNGGTASSPRLLLELIQDNVCDTKTDNRETVDHLPAPDIIRMIS